MSKPAISFVVPLFNEKESFSHLVQRLNDLIKSKPLEIEVVLVDDGSSDTTADLMRQIAYADPHYTCVFLARNYGHQIALSAGLTQANATEAIMVIDGDLQDPPELFTEFYNLYKQGYDVVYGIRNKRKESYVKKVAYHLFYRILKRISYIDLPIDSGDFSLISRRVVDVLNKMPEESRYIRGLRAWVGYKQIGYTYERSERYAGVPKYNFKMLYNLAYNGIFNFSKFPIKFISTIGVISILVSILYFLISLYMKLNGKDVPGFTGLLFTIILFGGVQLLSLGVMGEYLLRIFFQVKQRPLFIISEVIKESNKI